MAYYSSTTMVINTGNSQSQYPSDQPQQHYKSITTPLSPHCEESHIHSFDNLQPPSFESILSGTSKAPYSRVAFSNFLKRIHCSENLDFLLNSNQYLIRFNEIHNDYDHEVRQLWLLIYANYISPDSLKEVNIPHDLRSDLTQHFENDSLPPIQLIEDTMNSIKELLRDGYMQFIRSVRKEQMSFNDKINEHYSLLPTPTDEIHSPLPKHFPSNSSSNSNANRRFSECCSPLDPSASSRCVSPLSNSELKEGEAIDIPTSTNNTYYNQSSNSSEFDIIDGNGNVAKKDRSFSNSSKTKNSVSEASIGLKKLAGKFRWRRLSSNSSTASN